MNPLYTRPNCPICGRWNDPTGGIDAHSGGCPNVGKPYPMPPVPLQLPAQLCANPIAPCRNGATCANPLAPCRI